MIFLLSTKTKNNYIANIQTYIKWVLGISNCTFNKNKNIGLIESIQCYT